MSAHIIPFQFDSHPVRTLLIDDQPWFVASDICEALAIVNSRRALSRLDDDEKGVHSMNTLGGTQSLSTLNESGLYSLILTSRKPEAKRFKKWVTAEVLPTIRKHGHFHDADGKLDTLIGQTIGTNGFQMLGVLIKSKVANLPTSAQRSATAKLWAQTHAAFGVRSAADIPADQLDAARNFVAAYALDGEWLPAYSDETVLDSSDCTNLYALCHHMQALRQLDRQYHLYEALSQLGSPAGKAMYSHMVDGAAIAGRYLERLQQQVH